VRPKASGAGLICRTDQYFQRQRLPKSNVVKAAVVGS